MARRGPKLTAPVSATSTARPGSEPRPARRPIDESAPDDGRTLTYLAERLRRLALGLLAALITARAFFPSEPNLREGAGEGLVWVLLVLVTAGIALAVPLLGGRFRFRWSVTDALVIATMTFVAVSASHSLDRRPAINLAWEWVALGVAYLLVRNLPRTRNESSVLAGALVATAVSVSAYGLYQVKVELPVLQAQFKRNPNQMLQKLNITPGTRGELMLRSRLLGSTEPWSTFALANSLAGYIAGPLVILLAVSLYNLVRPDAAGSRWMALAAAAPLVLVLLVCLMLGKSRSAYIGVTVSLCLLAVWARRQVRPRALLAIGLSGAVLVAGLVAAGLATRRLDPQVLTQTMKSLRVRGEYWRSTWGVITDAAPTFWWGVGPGNFPGAYLKYKLPEASEEIVDPHNLLLEVWATGGVLAVACLLAALAWGFWNLLGPASRMENAADADHSRRGRHRRRDRTFDHEGAVPLSLEEQDDLPPTRTGWLMLCAGGGWALVVFLGWLNPFQADLFSRWLILGASWLTAALLTAPLWKRLPIPALALGAGALAVFINLLAAGGIGIPTVALALWSIVALGLNLRDDRACSRLREYESRMPALGMAVAWSALLGTFVGLVSPFWRCEAAIARGDLAMRQVPPDYELAKKAFENAATEDGYDARPWLSLAAVYEREWRDHKSKVSDLRWMRIPIMYDFACAAPRNPKSWAMHSERAIRIHELLRELAPQLAPLELTKYRSKIVEATRTASRLNPTNSELHVRLAHASADIMMFQDAVSEANEALRLDGMTPHPDRKLPVALRRRLEELIPKWRASAERMPANAKPL
jgi:hypothetical protein